MGDNELEQRVLDSLEQFEQRLDRIEEKIERMEEEKSFSTTLPQDDMDSTRKISEELVDNLKVEDIPANNFTLENNDNIIDFSSFAALKRPDHIMHEFSHVITPSQNGGIDDMSDKMLDVEELRQANVLMHELTYDTSSQSEIANKMVDEMEKGTIDVDGVALPQDLKYHDQRRMGFTNSYLILFVSCLSSVILFILGIFFIVGI